MMLATVLKSLWPPLRHEDAPSLGDRWHLAFTLGVSQLVFWVGVLCVLIVSPLNDNNLSKFEIRQFETSRAQSLNDPTPVQPWQRGIGNQWSETIADTPGLYRFNLNLKSTRGGAGVFVAFVRDNGVLYANGDLLGPPKTGNWNARPGLLGLQFKVPEHLLREGDNELILLVNRNSHFTRLGHVYAGSNLEIEKIEQAHDFTKITLPIVALTISAVLALIAGALLPLGMDRNFLLSALLTAVTIGIGTLFYLDDGTVTSHKFWLWYGNVLGAIGGYLAFVCLLNAWINGPTWVYRGSIVTFGLVAIVTAVVTPFLVYETVSYMLMALVIIVMSVALPLSLVALGHLVWTKKKGEHWLGVVLFISPLTALVDLILSLISEPQAIYFAPLSNPPCCWRRALLWRGAVACSIWKPSAPTRH